MGFHQYRRCELSNLRLFPCAKVGQAQWFHMVWTLKWFDQLNQSPLEHELQQLMLTFLVFEVFLEDCLVVWLDIPLVILQAALPYEEHVEPLASHVLISLLFWSWSSIWWRCNLQICIEFDAKDICPLLDTRQKDKIQLGQWSCGQAHQMEPRNFLPHFQAKCQILKIYLKSEMFRPV